MMMIRRLAGSLFFFGLAVVLDSSAAFTAVGRRFHHKHNNIMSSALRSTNLPEETEEDNNIISMMSRRSLFQNSIAAVATTYLVVADVLRPRSASALDFDAFASSQLSSDDAASNPTLSDDEALCKYGAPGPEMGAACKRAKMKPRLPSDVSADGKADRGDYTKCKFEWSIVNGEYVKKTICKSTREWGGPDVK